MKKWTSTIEAVHKFDWWLPRMGNIVRVVGISGNKQGARSYQVKFIDQDKREYAFDGFAWWYNGSGPKGLAECLLKLGVHEEIIEQLRTYSPETHGDSSIPNSFFINLTEGSAAANGEPRDKEKAPSQRT